MKKLDRNSPGWSARDLGPSRFISQFRQSSSNQSHPSISLVYSVFLNTFPPNLLPLFFTAIGVVVRASSS
ncbi:hypothetical protein E4U12_008148 [Claviceps purpurea]|nr:hypothetical protein E4U12_008148 [Claviceps purpurea]